MKKSILTFFLFAFIYVSTQAQWPSNKNFPITVASSQETELVKQTISDGSGGVYVAWSKIYGNGSDVHLSHYNSQGVLTFSYPVYASEDASLKEEFVGIITDGSGGAFVVWADQRIYPLCLGACEKQFYGQHIDAEGNKLWPADGLLLYEIDSDISTTLLGVSTLVPGANQDFYLVWHEIETCADQPFYCATLTNTIYAQRYDFDGLAQWASPKAVFSSVALMENFNFDAKYDAASNKLFIVWQDGRANTHHYHLAGNNNSMAIENYDIYIQSVNGTTGSLFWPSSGVMVNNVVDYSLNYDRTPNPKLAFDQSGVVITWVDYRAGGEWWGYTGQKSIYGTRLSKISGARYASWPAEGKLLSSFLIEDLFYSLENQIEYPVFYDLQTLPDNTYLLVYPGEENQLYAQKFNTNGAFQWGTGMGLAADVSDFNGYPDIIANENEPIICWVKTERMIEGGPPSTTFHQSPTILAQKLNQDGSSQWASPIQVNNEVDHHIDFFAVNDGSGGVHIAWHQRVSGNANTDVKLTSLSGSGKFKGGLTLSISNYAGAKGQILSVPVTVKDFEDILTLQASLQWDPTIVSFVEVADFGLAGLNENSFGLTNVADGSLTFSWDDLTAEGQNLDQDATLFSVKFELVGYPDDITELQITDQPLSVEAYYETGFEQASVNISNGFILIDSYQLSLVAHYLQDNQVSQSTGGIAGVDFYIDEDLLGTTNEEGEVAILTLPDPEGNIQVLTPSKTDSDKAGVDVADILMARDHLLGNVIFDSPYKMFAADVDGNGIISTIDIAHIRAYILAKQSNFNGKNWIFVNDYQFYDENQKYNTTVSPFTYLDHFALDYQTLDIHQLLTPGAIKFIGVKLGDVDASWAEEDDARTNTSLLEFTAAYNKVETLAEEFEVSIQSPALVDLAGMQFTLQWDPQVWQYQMLEAESLTLVLNEDRVNEGYLSLLWYSDDASQAISFEEGASLFKMKFRPLASGGTIEMNSDMTNAKAYTKSFSRHDLSLKHITLEESGNQVGVYPNPVQDKLSVKFTTSEERSVKFTITNSVGGVAQQEIKHFTKGFHAHDLNTTNLANGIYLLTLDVGEKRMKTVRIVKY